MGIRAKMSRLKKEVARARADAERVTAAAGGANNVADEIDRLTIALMRGEVTADDLFGHLPHRDAVLAGCEVSVARGLCDSDRQSLARLRELAPDLFPPDEDEHKHQ